MKISIEIPDSDLEKNCIHFIHLYTDNDKKITRVTQVKSGICKYDYYDEDIKFSEVVEQIEDNNINSECESTESKKKNNFGWINCEDYLPEKSGMYFSNRKTER